MVCIEILSKEDFQGIKTKVVVELLSDDICMVEDKQVPKIIYGTSYHNYLHDKGIEHSHNRQKAVVTVVVDNPFTEEKLWEALEESIDSLEKEASDLSNFQRDAVKVHEEAVADGEIQRLIYEIKDAPKEVIDTLMQNFPETDLSELKLISTPVWNSLLEKTVMTGLLWRSKFPDNILNKSDVPVFYRKYCIEDKKYFDKCYVPTTESHPLIPEGCETRFKSINTNVQEGLELPEFVDYYFVGDCDYIEQELGLPYKRGKYATQYGITIHNNEIVRKKQYCYDEFTNLSDWI